MCKNIGLLIFLFYASISFADDMHSNLNENFSLISEVYSLVENKDYVSKLDDKKEVDPIAGYETVLPVTSRTLPGLESKLLVLYLNNPNNPYISQLLAKYHLLLVTKKQGYGAGAIVKNKEQKLRHMIYASYFLNRAKNLNVYADWVDKAIVKNSAGLERLLRKNASLDLSEKSPAQNYFMNAFNYKEKDRYEAEERLLAEIVEKPGNVLTNLYASAVSLWNGGESNYDDPSVIYGYVLASFFAERARELTKLAETQWVENSAEYELFRLAPSIGGFTVPSRRWLAKLHGDDVAVGLLDAEHKAWLAKFPQFYSFPASVTVFAEPENFWGGFSAFIAGMDSCGQNPILFCQDIPPATFNNISFFLLGIDYFLKVGDLNTAQFFLSVKNFPDFNYDKWNLGHAAWEHREQNFEAIAEAYRNGDPSDDPVNGFLKKHKWGSHTSTCQLCHQVQNKIWSEEEINKDYLLDESLLFIGEWPASRVTWSGHVVE